MRFTYTLSFELTVYLKPFLPAQLNSLHFLCVLRLMTIFGWFYLKMPNHWISDYGIESGRGQATWRSKPISVLIKATIVLIHVICLETELRRLCCVEVDRVEQNYVPALTMKGFPYSRLV